MQLEQYNVSMATHFLRCSHQIGKNRSNYVMPCILLGQTRSGNAKIIVFGNRNWKNKEHVKQLRYVPSYRLKEIGGKGGSN